MPKKIERIVTPGVSDNPRREVETVSGIHSDQLAEVRAKHPGMLLLVKQDDDNYRFLPDDYSAVDALGVPRFFVHARLEAYLGKILRAGHRVGVMEQVPATVKVTEKQPLGRPRKKRCVPPGAFGARLTVAREAAGLTVDQLSIQLGVSCTSILRWETGAHTPRFEMAAKIARILGVSLKDFQAILAETED